MNRKSLNFTGIGIPSVIMLFIALIMTILTLLTYTTVNSNSRIVEREIEYTQKYYENKALEDFSGYKK